MMQLIELFSENEYLITFATTAKISERSADLETLGVKVSDIELNNGNFDDFVLKLNPNIVLFDRYITEEQFGWRVSEQCPNALRILDTEDLHFLRKAREQAVKQNHPVAEANLYTDITKRELASILRSDLSLIISEFELKLLQDKFLISSEILHYLPFLIKKESKKAKNLPLFEKRANFISIGNLHHAPNVDSILYLKNEIWPLIRKQLPQVQLKLYGAYAPQKVLELHNEKEGFLIKGWANDVNEVMSESRVCLAPLRFGAGLKGKLVDAMINGTPSVTTSLGVEGIPGELLFPGIIADLAQEIAEASVVLYSQKEKWMACQVLASQLLEKRFRKELFSEDFMKKVTLLQNGLETHRNANFIGQILQHQSLQSAKYMSKWIEEKNKN